MTSHHDNDEQPVGAVADTPAGFSAVQRLTEIRQFLQVLQDGDGTFELERDEDEDANEFYAYRYKYGACDTERFESVRARFPRARQGMSVISGKTVVYIPMYDQPTGVLVSPGSYTAQLFLLIAAIICILLAIDAYCMVTDRETFFFENTASGAAAGVAANVHTDL